jgi:L-rhamnose-H+ transport protein
MGSGAWPYKLMRKYQFEHWWFIAMLIALVIMPWTIALAGCPNFIGGAREIPMSALIKANLFATGWGVANVLCGLCYLRIGMGLTGAILTGLGVSVGTIIPMVFKGSGLFKDAPDLGSPASLAVLAGVGVMLIGVLFATFAGFGRDRELKKQQATSGGFVIGLMMTAAAGVLSAGLALSFVYGQGPVVEAMKANGAGEISANFAVWALATLGGAAVNVGYAVYLLNRNKSWHVLGQSVKEAALAVIMGVTMSVAIALMGRGMLMLGVLGASVGFGIQQAMQMTGTQAVGFISGEWRGVPGRPRMQMYAAIGVLIAAAVIMSYGNTLAKS